VFAAVAAAGAAVAFIHGGNLVVTDLATHQQRVVMHHAGFGPVRWSGDGKLVSSGGRIAGGPALPAAEIAWAPAGETAAYLTRSGGVAVWSPSVGIRTVVPATWGAKSVAWDGARLALGRTVCPGACALGTHHEVWLWDGKRLRRLVKVTDGSVPMPFAADPQGRVLWWKWPNSGSIAADGVALYAGSRQIASMLMYPDWVARCGTGLAVAVGGDRSSLHGKSIALDGRDVSADASRSWISPSCSPDGSVLVAAASVNTEKGLWEREHRALWQLLPVRRQLTHPPAGWTDEDPTVLAHGSILFVRTRQTSGKVGGQWIEHDRGTLELLHGGTLASVADLTYSANELSHGYLQFYGHYAWPQRVALRP
jgi:hypothetical protein